MYLAIIILPLLGSIASGFFGRKIGITGAQIITCSCVITTTLLAILAFFEVGLNNIPVSIELFRWIDSESLNVIWGFRFDSLTVCFVGLFYIKEIEAVLVLIQLYKIFIQNFLISGYPLFNAYPLIFPIGASADKIKNYSSIRNIDHSMDSNFLQWFVGFTDAEGNFTINCIFSKDKLTISSFSFMFKITLHKDDEKVLRYISDKLGIGGVRLYKDECIFNITDQKGIALLISIFDKYNLNTSKYLDYLDFKKAFFLYLNREKNLKAEEIKDKILELKNRMNTNRIHFDRPEDSKIVITKYWLLGFIEGDGSFFLRRDNITPVFYLENTGVQLPVLVKIKEFLENSLNFDPYSLYKLKNTSTIAIATIKARNNNGKSSASLTIKNIYVLNNYLIPFFSEMEFLTKKGKDFHDFKIICKVVYIGAHRREEIRSLVLKLSNTMNNFRLSTYKGTVENLSLEETEKLLYYPPTIEHLLDGRVIDSATKKILPKQNSCVYEICGSDGIFILANSLSEAASIVEIYPDTLSKYLDIEVLNLDGVFVEIKKHKIRRIGVFFP